MPALSLLDAPHQAAVHNYAIRLGPQTCMRASVPASLEVIKTAKEHINNDLMNRSTLCQNDDGKIFFF